MVRFRLRAILVILLGLVSLADGQQISPGFSELSLAPNQRKRLEFTVVNGEDIPLRCVLSVADMAPNLLGFPQKAPDYERGCATWMTLPTDTLYLRPRSARDLVVELKTPSDVAGGYYALIEGIFRAADPSLDGLNLSDLAEGRREFFPPTSFRSLVIAEVRARENAASVKTDSLFIASGREGREVLTGAGEATATAWTVDMVLRNSGTVHTRVAGTASIWRNNGTLVRKVPFQVGRGYVFPGTRRAFRARGRQALADGLYVGRFDFNVERQGRFQEVTTFFVQDGSARPGRPDSSATVLLESLLPKFSLREQFREVSVRPGRPASVIFSVRNTHEDIVRLRPVPCTWEVDSLGMNRLVLAGERDHAGAAGWVIEAPETIEVAARRTATCRLRVEPPDTIPPGEYYLGILLEENEGAPTPPDARLVRSQLVCLRNGRDLPCAVELDTLAVTTEERRAYVSCRLANTGETRVAAYPEARIRRRDATDRWRQVGDEIGFVGGETVFLFPGGSRVYEQRIDGLPPGAYRADLSVAFAEEQHPDLARTVFFEIVE